MEELAAGLLVEELSPKNFNLIQNDSTHLDAQADSLFNAGRHITKEVDVRDLGTWTALTHVAARWDKTGALIEEAELEIESLQRVFTLKIFKTFNHF